MKKANDIKENVSISPKQGGPRSSVPSKSIINRKIVELMSVSKKEGITSATNPKREVLEFHDSGNAGGI